MIQDASFTLHKGEVLGLAGLVGSGRTELLRLVAGIDRARSGRIEVNGRSHVFRSPREAIAAGIGLVPEERKKDGIVRDRSVASNIALPSMRRFSRMGLIRRRALRQEATDLMRQMNLRPPMSIGPSASSRAAISRKPSSVVGSLPTWTSCCLTSRPVGST